MSRVEGPRLMVRSGQVKGAGLDAADGRPPPALVNPYMRSPTKRLGVGRLSTWAISVIAPGSGAGRCRGVEAPPQDCIDAMPQPFCGDRADLLSLRFRVGFSPQSAQVCRLVRSQVGDDGEGGGELKGDQVLERDPAKSAVADPCARAGESLLGGL